MIDYDSMVEELRKLQAAEGSQRAAAEKLGVTASYFSYLLSGRKLISENVARKMGYRRVVLFEKLASK